MCDYARKKIQEIDNNLEKNSQRQKMNEKIPEGQKKYFWNFKNVGKKF